MDNQLPYTFDLVWDIKTMAQLVQRVAYLQEELRDFKEICEEEGIDWNSVTTKP